MQTKLGEQTISTLREVTNTFGKDRVIGRLAKSPIDMTS